MGRVVWKCVCSARSKCTQAWVRHGLEWAKEAEDLVRAIYTATTMRSLDAITGMVIETALQIHRDLGPGLLESVYEAILTRALLKRGLSVERQKPICFEYDGMKFDEGFRVDLLVEHQVVVELKSLEHVAPVHAKQVRTYLRLLQLPVGLLINFGAATLKDGLRRVVNDLDQSLSPALRVNQSPKRDA